MTEKDMLIKNETCNLCGYRSMDMKMSYSFFAWWEISDCDEDVGKMLDHNISQMYHLYECVCEWMNMSSGVKLWVVDQTRKRL